MRRLTIVLDPAVLVEAILDSHGPCAQLLRRVSGRLVDLLMNEAVREQTEATLLDAELRKRGGWSIEDARRWINALDILASHRGTDPGFDESGASVSDTGSASAVEERPPGPLEEAGVDRQLFLLARSGQGVVVTTDEQTLELSGLWGVDAIRPETVLETLEALSL